MQRGPALFLPQYLHAQRNFRPEWVGIVQGHNYNTWIGSKVIAGPQLAGHRILVIKPPAGIVFDPNEHVVDLGPESEWEGVPQIIVPNVDGLMDKEEMLEVVQMLREENKADGSGWTARQRRDSEKHKRKDVNERLRDFADALARARTGRKTYGPGSTGDHAHTELDHYVRQYKAGMKKEHV